MEPKGNNNPKSFPSFTTKTSIAKKFSIYILALTMVITLFLVVSVKSQEDIYRKNFDYNIKFTSRIIAESVKNAFIIQYYSFLNPLIELLTDEPDIVYVIILSEDNRVIESTIDSYNGKYVKELGDKFSAAAAHDTKLELRKHQDEYIRNKLEEDKDAIKKEINALRREYLPLRNISTVNQAKNAFKDMLKNQSVLETDLETLLYERERAQSGYNNTKLASLESEIVSKEKALEELKKLIDAVQKLKNLLDKIIKKDTLLKKMNADDMIYEVSVPLIATDGEKYGSIRIGFSPKEGNQTISQIYLKSILVGILFIIIGLGISLYLARTITKPIGELASGAQILGDGNLNYKINIKTNDEIEILAQRLNSMSEKLNESYTVLEQKVQERTREYLEATKELQRAYTKLQATQAQLVQSEKMKSLGKLVAGVAHELNNPIGFIYGNMGPLKQSVDTMLNFIALYKHLELKKEDEEKVSTFIEENDFDFLLEDMNDLIEDIKEGAERAQKIVLDLKNFSRIDEAEFKEVDVHHGINSTLNLLINHYKHRIQIHKEFGDIPLVYCYASRINQVWMNLLVNAFQAIKETGDVWIATYVEEEMVVVKIKDTGEGISQEAMESIFDPFFTTKPVGQGTGLGLSITHSIIKKHNGIIDVESETGKGTTFIVKLPIHGNKSDDDEN